MEGFVCERKRERERVRSFYPIELFLQNDR